jgi:hypothetical protein
MADAKIVLAHHPQVILEEQIVVSMDAARQRVFDGDKPEIAIAADNGFKDQLKRLAWNGDYLFHAEIGADGGLGVSAGFTLESDAHKKLI